MTVVFYGKDQSTIILLTKLNNCRLPIGSMIFEDRLTIMYHLFLSPVAVRVTVAPSTKNIYPTTVLSTITTLLVWVVGLAVGPRDIPVGARPGGRARG